MTNPAFAKNANNLNGRAATVYQTAFVIVPSNTLQQAQTFAALYIGVTGDVKVVTRNDDGSNAVVFKAVPAGTILPIAGQGVFATGTTATDMVGLA